MLDIVSAMQWRYATKTYDTTKKIPEDTLTTLLEATRLAPSSFGLPTWKVILVENPELRTKLQDIGWGQSQFTNASHLVIFAIERNIDAQLVDAYMQLTADTRNIDVAQLGGFRDMLNGSLASRTPETLAAWAAKQAYIGLGTLLTAAALHEVDATPMEGFDTAQCDAILGLEQQGLQSVVACALGYRATEDQYAHYTKVRLPINTFVTRMA